MGFAVVIKKRQDLVFTPSRSQNQLDSSALLEFAVARLANYALQMFEFNSHPV